ncbi:hypothetical protein CTAYLR_001299 [Chrysophaeum taylorii]|uniref:Arylamine N-acetyltransferase n=1 Tax=Chrysophaeum taylorii TaxID=2483200 RepID=A0AAD7XI72_9STRA|nr:hypothetical protein CTAYLR_001299 [Chrysophaeum taylorii]
MSCLDSRETGADPERLTERRCFREYKNDHHHHQQQLQDGGKATRLEYVGPEVLGRQKWLGAAASRADGVLWAIPGHAGGVLRIDPYESIVPGGGDGVSVVEGKVNRGGINRYKWLRGVSRADGSCLGLPMHADGVLKIESDGAIKVLDGAERLSRDEYKWHGGVVGANGCAYGVPCNADRVLKVDQDDRVTCFGSLDAGGTKWYGGIYSAENEAMYCIPFSASRVLKVALDVDACLEIGPDLGPSLAKWHGGTLGPDGRTIYGFPAHASSVLVVDTRDDAVSEIGALVEGRYKYGGGVVAGNAVYGIPSDATSVLKIVGRVVATFGSLDPRKNKVGRDGIVYCVPCDAEEVLAIDPRTDALRLLALPGGRPLVDKFQGGYADFAGRIWCVPENARRVLRLTPDEVCDEVFVDAYLDRLGVRWRRRVTLEEIVAAHLETIPFENIDHHLGRPPMPSNLSRVFLFEKLVLRRRGGDCFELNVALYYLLRALGHRVEMIPCRVYAGKERGRPGRAGYRAAPSHHALRVDNNFFVDVGFGEPPLGPLRYDDAEPQTTPDGMRSRILRTGDKLQLEWCLEGRWLPRLQWDRDYSAKTPEDLEPERDFVVNSHFSTLCRKLVVSRLTPTRKITVAGTNLKITQPRFSADQPAITVLDLGACRDARRADNVRAALLQHFGIPLRETLGLDLDASRSAPPAFWGHL